VLVVHEWWGIGDHAKESARRLAEAGYVALAVDMYGEGKSTDDPKQAGEWSGKIKKNIWTLKKRFEAALTALRARPEVDEKKIAAIGYCFGGTVVLEAARMGEPLVGVASFHGGLASNVPPDERKLAARVLVLHGAEDKFESDEEIAGFKTEMEKSGVKWNFVAYPGAVHSFTNPDVDKHNLPGAKYNAEAAKKSWEELLKFLHELFA
jgi:dienelactone hydrolase